MIQKYKDSINSSRVLLPAIAFVLLMVMLVAAYSVFDTVPLFQDIHDEMNIVRMMAHGKTIYYQVDSMYPPLPYKLVVELQCLTRMDTDDAVQWFTITIAFLTFLALCGLLALWYPRKPAAILMFGSIVVFFSLVHPNLMLSWRMGNMLSAFLSLLFLIVLTNPLQFRKGIVLTLSSLVCALCLMSKQTFGLVLMSTLLFYVALQAGRGGSGKRGVLLGKALAVLIVFGFVTALTAILWIVLVKPNLIDGVALQIILPVNRLGPGGHRDFYNYGPQQLIFSLSRLATTFRFSPGWFVGFAIQFGYQLDYLLKLAVIALVGLILKQAWRDSSQTRILSEKAILSLVLLSMNVMNAYLIDHHFQGMVDLVLTVASLAILLCISGIRFPIQRVCRMALAIVGFCVVTMCALVSIGVAHSAYSKWCCAVPVHVNSRLTWNLTYGAKVPQADAVKMVELKGNFERNIPNIQRQRVWIIDTGFLYYFLDQSCPLRHPYPYYLAINPSNENEYIDKLRQHFFDYIVIGRDYEIFGRFGESAFFQEAKRGDSPITTNRVIYDLIQMNYVQVASFDYHILGFQYSVYKSRESSR